MDFRPVGWLAAGSFAVGFAGYLALARPADPPAASVGVPATETVSGPVSDAWNFEKKI